jgi:hypothetical protein
MINVSAAILGLSSGTYTVTRTALDTYGSDGRLVAGATSTFTITASVQPANGRDLQLLAEGMRTREVVAIFTPTALKTLSSATQPDQVTIGSDTFQIQSVADWSATGGYCRAVAVKMGA